MKRNSKPDSEAQKLVEYLKEAASLPQHSIRDSNPFKFLGFDRTTPRLGWVRKIDYSRIEEEMAKFLRLVDARKNDRFLFLGMGGSINGVKVARQVFDLHRVLAWDTLDFSYYKEKEDFFSDRSAVMTLSLTKSGTTEETHLITKAFQGFLKTNAPARGLWLLDDTSLSKLYSMLKESEVRAFPLQLDKNNDIGGRFSAPNTMVFLAPLFLELEPKQIKSYWQAFLEKREEALLKAAVHALQFKGKENAYFAVQLSSRYAEALRTWITQLFQESLGSKRDDFQVKTIVSEGKTKEFIPAGFDLLDFTGYGEEAGSVFELMWYLQCFVASFSCCQEINFVNQDYVEEYKRVLKELRRSDECSPPAALDLVKIRSALEKKLSSNTAFRFIEAVYFGHLSRPQRLFLNSTLAQWFPKHKVFVFLGSDWNHHSYQAAFKSTDTFFPILIPSEYAVPSDVFPREVLNTNLTLLKQIACATYKTLSGKSELFCIGKEDLTQAGGAT